MWERATYRFVTNPAHYHHVGTRHILIYHKTCILSPCGYDYNDKVHQLLKTNYIFSEG